MTDGTDDKSRGKPDLRLVTSKRNDSEAVEPGKGRTPGQAPGASGRAASGLTNKQERFSVELSNGATNVAAYRAAYDASGMQATSVEVEACKLAAHPKVSQRVADLLAEKQAKAQLVSARTEDRIWRGVWELAEGADIAPATKATALALAARMAGLFNDKIEIKQSGSAADIERELVERLQRYAK